MTATKSLRIGEHFPAVELVDQDGSTWRSVDQFGRPLVLILHRHLA
ncbi:MAG: hypothetical protein ABIR32_08505 [Ilumatobacteraceae bacterium]